MKKVLTSIDDTISSYENLEFPYTLIKDTYYNYVDQIDVIINDTELLVSNPGVAYRLYAALIAYDQDIIKWMNNISFLFNEKYKDLNRFTKEAAMINFLEFIYKSNELEFDFFKKYLKKVSELVISINDDNIDLKTKYQTLLAKYSMSDIISRIDDISGFKKLIHFACDEEEEGISKLNIEKNAKYILAYFEIVDFHENKLISEQDLSFAYVLLKCLKNVDDINRFIDLLKKSLTKELIGHVINFLLMQNYEKASIKMPKIFIEKLNKTKNIFQKYANALSVYEKEFNFQNKKAIGFLQQVKDQISNYGIDDYIYSDSIAFSMFDKINEPLLKLQLVHAIFEHNKPLFKDLYEENREYEQDELENIITKYELPFIFSDNILKMDTKKINEVMETLKNTSFEEIIYNQNKLEYIILNSDVEKIVAINKIFLQLNIPMEFLLKHIVILGEKYEQFMQNALVINSENIQIASFDILLEDPTTLFKRISLVNMYNINLRKNSNNNCDFLITSSAFEYFDQYIELGYYSFIRNHLPYCKIENESILKRLRIAHSLYLNVMEEKEFTRDIATGKNFLLPDNMLDDYIVDDTLKHANPLYREVLENSNNLNIIDDIDIIKYLDQRFAKSTYEYQFNDIIISRIKVIRCLSTLLIEYKDEDINELLLNAIIYNSRLKEDEIEQIKSLLKNNNLNYKYV